TSPQEIGSPHPQGKSHLASRAAEAPIQLSAPTIFGEHPKYQARVGAHRINLHPAEEPNRPEIPRGLGHQSAVVHLSWPQENLSAYHRCPGLEVQLVAQSR